IGNGAYRHAPDLTNPVNDATEMARELRQIGFDTQVVIDADVMAMERALRTFGDRLRRDADSAGIFFYAGHAVQSDGVNYLLPVDADIGSESELRRKTIALQEILGTIEDARNRFNMVVLDACRDNPFAGSFRSASRGLVRTTSAPPETLVVYATDEGNVAADGTGRNSPFTEALLANLTTPRLDVELMIRRVTADVQRATGNMQRPWRYSSVTSEFFLVPAAVAAGQTAQPPQRTTPAVRESIPTEFVQGGTFRMGSPSGGSDNERPVRSVTVSSFRMARTPTTVSQFRAFANATGYRTTAETSEGGFVWTGSSWEARSDANWRNPYIRQTDEHPVVLISWYDAVAYANWLSKQDGLTPAYRISGTNVSWDQGANGWRLPTEAEWEFAARGGTQSRGYTYAGSNDVNDVAWYRENANSRTQPVAGKQPNELGLYDVSGNVWEWVWDWFGDYPLSAQTDPTGPSSGSNRVLRGGSWLVPESLARPAFRNDFFTPDFRNGIFGFRLVRHAVR
ncbi:MAG: SUMF1/EgtB/PvdO family nonheme iron enzyme, partial [Spirochaeta sp.]|nr:SUMF1/EgtB/PvdO family nonheme iron enzyme [Spirochaeta sp.]